MFNKEYVVSFYGKQYHKKPDGKEAALITNKLKPTILTYDFMAKRVGELGVRLRQLFLMGFVNQRTLWGSNCLRLI